jgi:hypothetical protein
MTELPPDPFISPETIAMMRGMRDLHSAALAAGFPEKIATAIIVGIISNLISAANQEMPSPDAEV